MKNTVVLLNQLFDIRSKMELENLYSKFERNFDRIFDVLEEEGFIINNPIGESYTDSRTDVEANLVGTEGRKMIISKVIKPIIYLKDQGGVSLVQKGVVIVEKA